MVDSAADMPEAAPDPAVARAERRLRLLERLTEIGMELAEALRERAGDADAKGRDPADAYARLSRAIRLTIALEEKTDRALADLEAGIVREREARRAIAAEKAQADANDRYEQRKYEAYCRVICVIDAESRDQEDFEGLVEALDERLSEDEAYDDLSERPLREIVERLCRDLSLSPDWSHWAGDDWDDAFLATVPGTKPFMHPSRRPLVWAWPPAGAGGDPPVRRLE